MTDNRKNLDILGNLKYLALFAFVLVGVLLILAKVDEKRKWEVTEYYVNEANDYISKNQKGLEKIFNEGFANTVVDQYSKKSILPEVNQLISSDLKDFSSTFFIKEVTPGQIEYLRLSKEVGTFSIFPSDKQNEVLELLRGNISVLPWGEYTYLLNSKEVIIPVKNTQGQIVGALVRGVIE